MARKEWGPCHSSLKMTYYAPLFLYEVYSLLTKLYYLIKYLLKSIMALVLYQGTNNAQQSSGPASGTIGQSDYTSPEDIQNITNQIENLTSKQRQKAYIGLGNQGATCYMNSLLQSLYMTPEFRQFIYSWQYIPDLHGDKDYCIPYQLQKLFAKLQLSRRSFVDTKGLTKSFGWDNASSFE